MNRHKAVVAEVFLNAGLGGRFLMLVAICRSDFEQSRGQSSPWKKALHATTSLGLHRYIPLLLHQPTFARGLSKAFTPPPTPHHKKRSK